MEKRKKKEGRKEREKEKKGRKKRELSRGGVVCHRSHNLEIRSRFHVNSILYYYCISGLKVDFQRLYV